MKKKSLIILSITTLTAGSLLLALVFSPLRNYYADNSSILDKTRILVGVDFNGNIKNARNSQSFQHFSTNFLNIPQNAGSALKRSGSSSVSGGTSDSYSYSSSFLDNNLSGKYGGSSGSPSSENNSGLNGSNNFVGNSSIGMLSSSSNTNAKKTTTKTGFISTTTNLSSTMKAGNTKLNGPGGPPPDGGGDTPPNLPIGDGVYFLLLAALSFGFIKFKKI